MLHRNPSLPISHQPDPTSSVTAGIRRRLSSVSLRIQPSSATQWALRRSKSVSSMGESASTSIRNWWDWGWGWILSRKPVFGPDLEFNNNNNNNISNSNGRRSWSHVFHKVGSEIRKIVRSDKVGLPQYNSGSYARNFDDGNTRY